jgi:hypothetical protein
MNYIVHWTAGAIGQLATVWTAASDRTAVTEASYRLEMEIRADPYGVGVPRNTPLNRTAVELPLGIEYEIIEDDKTVRILSVWAI